MQKILIVDNSDESRCRAQVALSSQFECASSTFNGETYALANEHQPDIILIDIKTSESEHFSSCKQLLTLNGGKKSTIVFVLDTDDSAIKLRAYEAGGYDFITKPFSDQELVQKMSSLGGLLEERNHLIATAHDTEALAMTSMKQASHYGYIMNFFKNLFHSSTSEEVATLFFEAMDFWNLKACLALRIEECVYFSSATSNQISPIERKIFVALQDAGRLCPFSNRLLINDSHASFLIKNMPKDEAEAGEVRDIVAAIIEGLEAKVVDLKRQAGLNLVTNKLNNTINNVESGVTTHNQLISSVMTDMMGTVASSFHALELTEMQEAFFHDLFEKSGKRFMQVEDVLLDIQEQLSLLSNQVSDIIKDTTLEQEAPVFSSTDVELF